MRNWLLLIAAALAICLMLLPDPASARPGGWRAGGPGIGAGTMAFRGGAVGWRGGWGYRAVGWGRGLGWGGRWAWGPAVGYGYASYAPYAYYGAVYPPVYYPGAYAYSGYCPY